MRTAVATGTRVREVSFLTMQEENRDFLIQNVRSRMYLARQESRVGKWLSLPFNRRTRHAAILAYKWCRPPTLFSSTTLPFSMG